MGYYPYKDVAYRGDFGQAVRQWEAEEEGRSFDNIFDYTGDGWAVAAYLLDKKDEEIEKLQQANSRLLKLIELYESDD